MKSSKYIAAAALSLLAIAGAHAETYNGVHPLVSANSRAEVVAGAVIAAHSANPYGDDVSSRVAPVLSASTDRASVRNEAVAAAHGPDRFADGYGQGVTPVAAGTVDRAAIRAEARAAAHGDQLAL